MATDVKSIRTKRDHEAALKEVERLWGAKTGTPEGDRPDVLATLIDAYGRALSDGPARSDRGHRVPHGATGLTRRDLEEIIGTRTRNARNAEVLNRKRGLSITMIRRLHERPGITADVLIRPSRKKAA